MAEFADKGGVGMEPLPDAARAAVATAQRLVAAQAKVSNHTQTHYGSEAHCNQGGVHDMRLQKGYYFGGEI